MKECPGDGGHSCPHQIEATFGGLRSLTLCATELWDDWIYLSVGLAVKSELTGTQATS